jgi:hypothetical protein
MACLLAVFLCSTANLWNLSVGIANPCSVPQSLHADKEIDISSRN